MDSLLAAVDLGSNSFRLSIGRVAQHDGDVQIFQVDRLKETVRLAAGLDSNLVLSEEAIDRAVAVLERFGERLRSFPSSRVRAVATNTFRVARNAADFLPRAEAALGFPIEVISGQEEARLIFCGVSHSLPPLNERRLVVDIGGGSTEVIIGKGNEPVRMASLHMGCVSFSQRFFPDGKITAERMHQADIAARREIESITRQYRKTGWAEAYGSSGTAKALYAILTEGGYANAITAAGMRKLKTRLIQSGCVIPSELPGIKLERADVLPGGLAIMGAIVDELGVENMKTGDGALRVGVLHDLLGRDDQHTDKRRETVRLFMKRYHIDGRQAERVRTAAHALFDKLCPRSPESEELRLALGWAADLHEIGLSISHDAYHRHTAYVLQHADMPGFSNAEQDLLALLTLGHQGKLSKIQTVVRGRRQWLAILSLRLAVLLMRRRQDIADMPLSPAVDDHDITITAKRQWLADRPLSDYSLRAEEPEWRKVGFTFNVAEI